ncbi:MAG: DUF2905 domain-containing protein [Bacteroidota bacterium]|nr:DUF2905 domain-containing protein [Bacteroidota bacterium]
MEEQLAFLRLLLVLLLLTLAVVAGMLFVQHIPLIGALPGDVEFDFPGISIYVPFTTTLLLSIILTAIAFLVQRKSKK